MPPRPTTEQISPPAYAYDVRGRKVAEYGTAVQPAAYEYDDAGRLTALTRRIYAYDKLGRSTTRQIDYPARQTAQEATFGYNHRSELTSAQVSGELYGYDYDNIGKTADGCKAGWTCAQHAPRRGEATRGCRRINRRLAFGGADYAVYTANELNQYTKVDTNGNDFTPEYDADGNQTLVQTGTGIWRVTYNAQNRAVKFEREDGNTVITCAYDYMGRRIWKKVTTNGTVTLHERYIYRKTPDGCKGGWTCAKHAPRRGEDSMGRVRINYLQIAVVDLLANTTKHAILWDPTQPTATRPLAIQQGKKWHTYAWDLTKNITALFTPTATLSTTYTYTPFGKVSANGDVDQPVQWSSEMHDPELSLIYYNYRYYNPTDGRWTRRDPIDIEGGLNLYGYIHNRSPYLSDHRGLYISVGAIEITFSPQKGYQGGDTVATIHAKPFGGSSSVFLCAQGNIDAKIVIKISYPEDNEGVLRHESIHAFIALGLWVDFINAVEPYDYTYFCTRSSCCKNFQRYIKVAVEYYNALICRDNLLFDVEDYPRRNISLYHIEKTKARLIETENLVKKKEREFMNLKQTMKEKCQ